MEFWRLTSCTNREAVELNHGNKLAQSAVFPAEAHGVHFKAHKRAVSTRRLGGCIFWALFSPLDRKFPGEAHSVIYNSWDRWKHYWEPIPRRKFRSYIHREKVLLVADGLCELKNNYNILVTLSCVGKQRNSKLERILQSSIYPQSEHFFGLHVLFKPTAFFSI